MEEIKNLFDWTKVKIEDIKKRGIYKITNKVNGDFYVGSTYRSFKARWHEHQNSLLRKLENGGKFDTPHLCNAFIKYGFNNFYLEILEIIESDDQQYIRSREKHYVNLLHPKYNICEDPEYGGKPNKNRKLTEEWKQKIAKKSAQYKHNEESLKIVTRNNKNNACKIILSKDNEIKYFNSWVEVAKFFNLSRDTCSQIRVAMKAKRKYKGWTISQQTTQKKQIKVFFSNENIKIFNSFAECDRALDMWRGYTSTVVTRKINLLKDKYQYELV